MHQNGWNSTRHSTFGLYACSSLLLPPPAVLSLTRLDLGDDALALSERIDLIRYELVAVEALAPAVLLPEARLAADPRSPPLLRADVVVELDALEPPDLARDLDLLGDEDAGEPLPQDGPEDGDAAGDHCDVDLDGGEDDADGRVPGEVERGVGGAAVLQDGDETGHGDAVDTAKGGRLVLSLAHGPAGSQTREDGDGRTRCRWQEVQADPVWT